MDTNPYSDENMNAITFTQLSRIYDVLMALLTAVDKEASQDLLSLHKEGNILTPYPFFNGIFITDEINEEEEE